MFVSSHLLHRAIMLACMQSDFYTTQAPVQHYKGRPPQQEVVENAVLGSLFMSHVNNGCINNRQPMSHINDGFVDKAHIDNGHVDGKERTGGTLTTTTTRGDDSVEHTEAAYTPDAASEWVWGEIDEASSSTIGSVDIDMTSDDHEIEDPKDLLQLWSDTKGEAA
ncbi:hypothetical protein BYT27DRAFT_7215478 [Phlegmacium glaucopus]|nr:hypothetical protein BYT27DRAFT_7215478 [Phlegmacium glaucopus]